MWESAYLKELAKFKQVLSNHKISSIFFGGGTPSLMPTSIVSSIINFLDKDRLLSDDIEITLEANPTSFEANKFCDFKKSGINRLSLGIQALNDHDLKFLGREHSAAEAINVIETTAKLFDNYSFDLIYARPEQTISEWKDELDLAISLAAKHISLYQLTIEKGTKFFSMYKKKEFVLPSEENSLELFLTTDEILQNHGFNRYEVSNHAIKGYESKHNMVYWNYGNYLGIGPGAHSRIDGVAKSQFYKPQQWLDSVFSSENPATFQKEHLTKEQIFSEIIMMGLRTTEGVSLKKINKYGCLGYLDEVKIVTLEKELLLNKKNDSLVLTDLGLQKINSVVQFLLP